MHPGVVIDGQHRLAGSTKSRPITPFAVTAILDADLEQQIVQFVVINVKQRKLNPRFTSGVFASYMDRETMESVAEETGLDMTGPQIFLVLNTDPHSAFLDLIDDTESGTSSKLGYVTMVGTGRAWLKPRPRVLKQRYKAYRKQPGETKAEFEKRRQDDWKKRCWDLCFTFWNEVSRKYPDLWSDLATRKLDNNYLRQAVVLEQLQAAFFDFWETQVFTFPRGKTEEERFTLVTSNMTETLAAFLKNLPQEVFAVRWRTGTSLNDARGRGWLSDFFTHSWRKPTAFKRREAATQEPRWRSLVPVGEKPIRGE